MAFYGWSGTNTGTVPGFYGYSIESISVPQSFYGSGFARAILYWAPSLQGGAFYQTFVGQQAMVGGAEYVLNTTQSLQGGASYT